MGLNRQNLLAILSIVFLTWINTRGLRIGKIVQNIFTVTKTGSLAGLVLLGFWFSTAAARARQFHGFLAQCRACRSLHPYPPDHPTWMIGTLTLVGVAMVGSLFAMDAWNNITFTAAEVKNPGRNLPLSLALGTGIVIAALHAGQCRLSARAADLGRSERRDGARAGNRVRGRRPRGHGCRSR